MNISEIRRIIRERAELREARRRSESIRIGNMLTDVAALGGENGVILTVYTDHALISSHHAPRILEQDLSIYEKFISEHDEDSFLPISPDPSHPRLRGKLNLLPKNPMEFPRVGRATADDAKKHGGNLGLLFKEGYDLGNGNALRYEFYIGPSANEDYPLGFSDWNVLKAAAESVHKRYFTQ